MPGSLYGAEHLDIPNSALNTLRRQLASTLGSKPMGVNTLIKLLPTETVNDPYFKAKSAPILRWAREVWLSLGPPSKYRHSDVLSGLELHRIANILKKTQPGDLPQGPLRALGSALKWFGWTMDQAFLIKCHKGLTLDLTAGSPAMLRFYLIEAAASKINDELNSILLARDQIGTHKPNWEVIHRFMKKQMLKAPS